MVGVKVPELWGAVTLSRNSRFISKLVVEKAPLFQRIYCRGQGLVSHYLSHSNSTIRKFPQT
jgi:hypothetical protein